MFLKYISLLNYAETKKWSYRLFFQIIQDFIITHVSTFSEIFLKLQVTFSLPFHFTLHGHFGISCKANLMVTNSFSFTCKYLNFFLTFEGQFFPWMFWCFFVLFCFSFGTLNILAHCLQAFGFLWEIWIILLWILVWDKFPLVVFKFICLLKAWL